MTISVVRIFFHESTMYRQACFQWSLYRFFSAEKMWGYLIHPQLITSLFLGWRDEEWTSNGGNPQNRLERLRSASSSYSFEFSSSPNDNGFTCSNCLKTYRHHRSLQRHQVYECGKEPQQKCQYCPYVTKLKENLLKHVKGRHPSVIT